MGISNTVNNCPFFQFQLPSQETSNLESISYNARFFNNILDISYTPCKKLYFLKKNRGERERACKQGRGTKGEREKIFFKKVYLF